MTTHPIYNKSEELFLHYSKLTNNYDKFINLIHFFIKKNNRPIELQEQLAITAKAVVFKEIILNNHNYIKINKEDWNSDVTKKTLESLKIKDLNLAFKAGTIDYGNIRIFFAYISEDGANNKYRNIENVSQLEGKLHICFNDIIGAEHIGYKSIEYNDFVIDKDRNYDENTKEVLTILLSVLLYASMFKNIKDRVKETKIIGKKSSKRNIPKHTINQINLFQKISNEKEICGREGSKWKSDKRWLVRGHMRNQFYKSTGEYKLIFIDPFWKGDGIEEVEKVYNI